MAEKESKQFEKLADKAYQNFIAQDETKQQLYQAFMDIVKPKIKELAQSKLDLALNAETESVRNKAIQDIFVTLGVTPIALQDILRIEQLRTNNEQDEMQVNITGFEIPDEDNVDDLDTPEEE